MITNLVNMELAFVNTNHPDFKLDEVIGHVMLARQQSQQTAETEVLYFLYFYLVFLAPSRSSFKRQETSSTTESTTSKSRNFCSSTTAKFATIAKSVASFFAKWIFQYVFQSQCAASTTATTKETYEYGRVRKFVEISLKFHRPQNFKNNAYGQPPLRLDPVPNTLTVTAIPHEREFEIELLGNALLINTFF
jgi:hypothetical protein